MRRMANHNLHEEILPNALKINGGPGSEGTNEREQIIACSFQKGQKGRWQQKQTREDHRGRAACTQGPTVHEAITVRRLAWTRLAATTTIKTKLKTVLAGLASTKQQGNAWRRAATLETI